MDDNSTLITYVSLLLAMSISTERAVEILKGLLPHLYERQAEPRREACRQTAIQGIAVGCGALTAFLSRDFLPEALKIPAGTLGGALGLGLLLSGGSGLWNSILTYLVGLKELKKVAVLRQANEVAEKT